jgi:hypothetical protein
MGCMPHCLSAATTTLLTMLCTGIIAGESLPRDLLLPSSVDLDGPAGIQERIDAASCRITLLWPRATPAQWAAPLFPQNVLAGATDPADGVGPMVRLPVAQPRLGEALDALASAGGWSWMQVHGAYVVFQETAGGDTRADPDLARLLDPAVDPAERETLARIVLRPAGRTSRLAAVLDRVAGDPGLASVLDRVHADAGLVRRSMLFQDIAVAIAADPARVIRMRAWLEGLPSLQPWHLRLATLIDDRRWTAMAMTLAGSADDQGRLTAYAYLAWCGDVAAITAAPAALIGMRNRAALIAQAGLQASTDGRRAATTALLDLMRGRDRDGAWAAVQGLRLLADPTAAGPLADWFGERTAAAPDPFAPYDVRLATTVSACLARSTGPTELATILGRWQGGAATQAWAALTAAAARSDDAVDRLDAAIRARLGTLRSRAAADEPTLGVAALRAQAARIPIPESVVGTIRSCAACHPAGLEGGQVRICRTSGVVQQVANRLSPAGAMIGDTAGDRTDDLLRWLAELQVPPSVAADGSAIMATLTGALVELRTPAADAALGRLLDDSDDDPLGLAIWTTAAATRSQVLAERLAKRLTDRGAGRFGGMLTAARHPIIRDALLAEAARPEPERYGPALSLCGWGAPWLAFAGGAVEQVHAMAATPPTRRQELIIGMLRSTPADDAALVERALRDPEPSIRLAAIRRLGPTAALSALSPAQLADPGEPAITRAVRLAESLTAIAAREQEPQVLKGIVSVLREPIPGMRRAAPTRVALAVLRAMDVLQDQPGARDPAASGDAGADRF